MNSLKWKLKPPEEGSYKLPINYRHLGASGNAANIFYKKENSICL